MYPNLQMPLSDFDSSQLPVFIQDEFQKLTNQVKNFHTLLPLFYPKDDFQKLWLYIRNETANEYENDGVTPSAGTKLTAVWQIPFARDKIMKYAEWLEYYNGTSERSIWFSYCWSWRNSDLRLKDVNFPSMHVSKWGERKPVRTWYSPRGDFSKVSALSETIYEVKEVLEFFAIEQEVAFQERQ